LDNELKLGIEIVEEDKATPGFNSEEEDEEYDEIDLDDDKNPEYDEDVVEGYEEEEVKQLQFEYPHKRQLSTALADSDG
jgi:transcriptional regulator of aromatic amino acid metabolism